MKTLREYFEQEAATYNRPRVGDDFAINAREECLLETYVCDEREDGIVLHADDRMMSLLEGYGWLESEETDECDYDIDSEESEDDVIEPADRGEYDDEGGMAKDDLHTIVRAARRLNGMLDDDENMPEWVQSKINKAADYVDTAADYIESNKEQEVDEGVFKQSMHEKAERMSLEDFVEQHGHLFSPGEAEEFWNAVNGVDEAKYRGREVPLGKPMKGDVKKSKVYVKGPKGNVVKVNFGDPNMRIKKSNPKRRKSFRARHHCDNPGPRWKARYWSCRAW